MDLIVTREHMAETLILTAIGATVYMLLMILRIVPVSIAMYIIASVVLLVTISIIYIGSRG